MVGKPGPASSGRTPAQATPRPARASGTAGPVQFGSYSSQGQPVGPTVDASSLARDPAGVRTAINANSELAGGSTGVSAGPETRGTFAALDMETATGTPAWVHSGVQRAEAGFQDPALGWVGVRAGLGGGGVHASLVPESADAAQTLGGHLAGLNAFLAEQHTPVQSVTLGEPESRPAAFGMNQGASQDTHQGTGQGMGQDLGQGMGQDGSSGRQSSTPADVPAVTATASPLVPAQAELPEFAVQAAIPGGVHISVMA